MTWKQLFTSSLGKKILMGLTGFFLIIYLIVHASINAMIFYDDDGEKFNAVASFMLHNYFVRFLEVGLFATFILHIIQGLLLWKQNRSARKINYVRQKFPREIKWYSRYMGWLGTFISYNAFISLLGKHQTRIIFQWACYRSLPGNENNIYESCMVYFIYDWVSFTFVPFAARLSKRFSNLWNKPQEMDSHHKRNRRFLFNCYLHFVCNDAHFVYGRMATINYIN